MKTSSVSLLLLTAAVFLVPARAEEEMKPTEDQPAAGVMTKKHQELVKRYDRNGDGRLDDDEKAAAHAAMRKAGGERKEGAKAEREWRMERLKRFDKDGDGRLDEREKEAARKAFMEKRARRPAEKKEP